MRREKEGSWSRRIARCAAIAILFSSVFTAYGQTLPAEVADLMERLAEEGSSREAVAEYFEDLALRKPDINRLSRRDLERTHLLSVFQIESLLDHRERYGNILSEGELALVDGFNPSVAALCGHFFSFAASLSQRGGWSHDASLKLRKPLASPGVSVTAKYKASSPAGWGFGFTADSDAGEGLSSCLHPDFVSAHIRYRGDGLLREAVLGDYTVRAGQGLVLWKAFPANASGAPSSIVRHPSLIDPYTSSDESDFFRGAALTLSRGGCDISAFASYNALDARIVDGRYTSIATDGYHRTPSEIAKRHSMHEVVVGTAASAEAGRWRFGVTAVAYTFDRPNGRTVKEYNRLQQYDGWWGNVGADFFVHFTRWRIFAEAALDAGGGAALLAGAVFAPIYEVEMSLLCRHYGKDYIATHSGAYSTISSCSNQDGLTFAARWYASKVWSLSANADYSFYPWPRYGIPAGSHSFKSRISAVRKFSERSSLDMQLQYRHSPDRISIDGRVSASVVLSEHCSLEGRVAANTGGWAAFAGCRLSFLKGRLEISGRFTIYDIDGYDNRIYFYEGNVPQTFSTKAYYGKGTGEYLIVKYSPVKWLSLWLRASNDYCSFFTRIFIPG